MSKDFLFYLFCMISVLAGVMIVKKITGCLIKGAVLVAVIVVLAIIYFSYFKGA